MVGSRYAGSVRRLLRSVVALAIATAGLAVSAAPAAAVHAAPWRFTSVEGDLATLEGSAYGGYVLQCPAGYTAVSGGVWGSNAFELRRLLEYPSPFDGTFHILVYNSSTVRTTFGMRANCVWLDDVGTITTVTAEFGRNSSGRAGGILRCPAGSTVLSGGVDWSNFSRNRRIDWSTPITDGTTQGTGWYVAGYSDVSGVLGIELRCVSSSLLGAEYTEADDSTTSPGGSAAAECASGYRTLTGGVGPAGTKNPGVYQGYSSGSAPYFDKRTWLGQGLQASGVVLRALELCVPASTPSVTFTQTPPALSTARSGSITFTAVDTAGEGLTIFCYLDGGPGLGSCSSGDPESFGPLVDGPHTITVTAYNESGVRRDFPFSWTIDATAPIANVVQPSTPFKKATIYNVIWSGSDVGSGVQSYDVRHRTANFDGSFGPYTLFRSATTATSASFNATPGHTDCWSVRARDNAGNVSAYSREKCTALPVDDRALARVTGTWSRLADSNAYQRTFSQASAGGATLQRTGVRAKRLNLLVTKCPTCGKVQVRLGATLLATIDTHATTTQYKAYVPVAAFSSVTTGTVSLTVSGSGKPVRIDGLGVSRV